MKTISMDGVIDLVAQSRLLFLPGSTGAPQGFLSAIAARPGSLSGRAIVTAFVSGLNDFAPLLASGARLTGFFPAPAPAALERLIPSTYFGIDRHISALAPDMLIAEVAPPSADGSCALGIAADFVRTAWIAATVRVAMINPALPDLPGAPRIALSDFTHGVESAVAPLVVDSRSDAISSQIAGRVASLIPDRATLQMGIGRIPAAVLSALAGHRGLRFHSGIVTGGIRSLVAAGALAPGRSVVAASLGGDAEFYAWLNGREEFRLEPVCRTHAPATLAFRSNFVSINSAIEVDLTGQVNAEWVGGRRISAPGGMPDFAHAAQRGAGGLAVIALPATDASGRHSRIVTRLGVPPTLAAGGIDVVATEYGIADLRGRTSEERADLIVEIAAPSFRDALRAGARA